MPDLNIRGVDAELIARLKVEAAGCKITLRELVLGKLSPREANGDSGDHRVSDVPRDGAVRANGGRKPAARRVSAGVEAGSATLGKPPITLPSRAVCVNCEHGKSMHRGHGTACQEANCRCGGFE